MKEKDFGKTTMGPIVVAHKIMHLMCCIVCDVSRTGEAKIFRFRCCCCCKNTVEINGNEKNPQLSEG